MKKLLTITLSIIIAGMCLAVMAGDRGQGQKCMSDAECEFNLQCREGACVKKKEFDFGSSGKSGQPCTIDADCINSGKCVEGTFGKKVCSGN